MRKTILFIVCSYFYISNLAYSAEIAIGAAAKGAVEGLLPILQPIMEETILDSIKHVKGIMSGKKCLIGCTKIGSVYCHAEKGRSTCKAVCQKIQNIGPYTLRIRFGVDDNNKEKWSLAACVRHGIPDNATVEERKKLMEGKKIPNSIAIYSKVDLDRVLELIKYQMAAQTIIDTGGRNIKQQQLNEAKSHGGPETREKAVTEAKELVKSISDSLNTDVYLKFGQQ